MKTRDIPKAKAMSYNIHEVVKSVDSRKIGREHNPSRGNQKGGRTIEIKESLMGTRDKGVSVSVSFGCITNHPKT